MSLLDKYRALVADGVIEADPAQAAAAARLQEVARNLRHWRRREGLAALLKGTEPAPKGLYIFGPVGRGKTMLMDLFYEAVTFRPKRRVHFHAFMAEVHELIGAARKEVPGDPIPQVARALAAKARLLCFDELHVTDIADAMILGRLFRELFAAQVVVVATSNSAPHDLYKNGLNRALFLPFIDLIGEHMGVEELLAAKDFRLDKLMGKPLYFTPADAHARAELDRLWRELTGSHPGAPAELDVKGRKVRVPAASMGVARFAFADLCEQPLGAGDFLHIAHAFHTVLIEAIPVLSPSRRDVTRRFINLVDTLYDNRVCLIASAAAEPAALLPAGDMQFLFERTSSRLIEMRSESYLTGRIDRLNRVASA
ncbi:MAG TPA: cell division protein ZapE [Hyphomicrobiaceae bacterium]|nr:cell division protein ZapE [Hyphomicrobiaceae bacterium]